MSHPVSTLHGMAGPKGQRIHHRVPAPPPAARRHCWVAGTPDAPGPYAGLILAWEQRDGVWFGQVVYVLEDDGATVIQWLRQDLLTPVNA